MHLYANIFRHCQRVYFFCCTIGLSLAKIAKNGQAAEFALTRFGVRYALPEESMVKFVPAP
jgi:hypothetical protein